ncbi:unnamed protein product, partial [Prorocentrum cordatum]
PLAPGRLHAMLWEDLAREHRLERRRGGGWTAPARPDGRLYGPPPQRLLESAPFAELRAGLGRTLDALFGAGAWRLDRQITTFADCPDLEGRGPPREAVGLGQGHGRGAGGEGQHIYTTMLLRGSGLRAQRLAGAVAKGGQTLKLALAAESAWLAELFGAHRLGRSCRDTSREASSAVLDQLDHASRARRLLGGGVVSRGVCLRVEELTGERGDTRVSCGTRACCTARAGT